MVVRSKSPAQIAVFCDFDGTIARHDVGYHMFRHFSDGRNEEVLPAWKDGTRSTRDCLQMEAQMVKATPEEIYRFLDQFELDESFVDFEHRCRNSGVPVTILSEGLDFYIRYILSQYELSHLTVMCNIGHLESNSIRVEFPFTNKSCQRCGNCKGERISEYRRSAAGDLKVVYVGDGYSDTCAIAEADFLFAKKDLERYCLERNIRYYKYINFEDVIRLLTEKNLLTARTISKGKGNPP